MQEAFRVLDAIARGDTDVGEADLCWVDALKTISWVHGSDAMLRLTVDGRQAHQELAHQELSEGGARSFARPSRRRRAPA